MAPRGLVIKWKAVGWAVVVAFMGWSIADFTTEAQRHREKLAGAAGGVALQR